MLKKNIKKIFKSKFIHWLNISEEEINTLKLYEIEYNYHNYTDKYSPTGKNGYFGSFSFNYDYKDNSNNSFPVAMELIIANNKVAKTIFYDI